MDCSLKEKELINYGIKKRWWKTGTAFKYHCKKQIFSGIDWREKTFLDVGCGNGRYSLWAATHGAKVAVGMEPSLEGSRGTGAASLFCDAVKYLTLNNVSHVDTTFQMYESSENYWDVVLLSASINHLAEDACETLKENVESQKTYIEIFSKLHSIIKPGGQAIITDCSNKNLFADLGIKNPMVPTIEWEKHQSPKLWSLLLRKAGFSSTKTIWLAPGRYFAIGKLLNNPLYAYCTRSFFLLRASK